MNEERIIRPKVRPTLPARYSDIYNEHYKNNREGNTPMSFFSQKIESWLHKQVAEDVQFKHKQETLEIGAGTLNQLKYEIPTNYDVIEPFTELYEDSDYGKLVRTFYNDISEISTLNKYDRIISVATLEHVLNLQFVVAKSALLLNKDGSFRASIPNEGYPLWKFCYMISTGLEFYFRYKLNYQTLMNYEHVNNADEIETVLRFFFDDVKVNFFGLNKKIAIYRSFECHSPRKELAQKIINLY